MDSSGDMLPGSKEIWEDLREAKRAAEEARARAEMAKVMAEIKYHSEVRGEDPIETEVKALRSTVDKLVEILEDIGNGGTRELIQEAISDIRTSEA